MNKLKKIIHIKLSLLMFILVPMVAFMLLTSKVETLGIRSFVVLTGSMSPAFEAGSVIFTQKIAQYKPGDIIAFKKGNVTITHRIVGAENNQFKTKGDANNAFDEDLVNQTEVLGKQVFTIPYLGRFINFLQTPLGFILFIIFPGILLIIFEALNIKKEMYKEIEKKLKKEMEDFGGGGDKTTKGLVIVLALMSGMLTFQTSYAFFTDSATSTSNVFAAASTFPVSAPISATPSPTSSPEGIANHLVISEVQIATAGASTSDFIELYNPTNIAIDLNPFRLVKRTDGGTTDESIVSFTSSHSIPAHGFFLWASSDGDFDLQLSANTSTGANIAADNSVAIKSDDLTITIDAVGWGTPAGTPLTEGTALSDPPVGQSLERKALSTSDATSMAGSDSAKGNGYDTNNNSTDFILRATSQPQNSSSTTESP